MSQFPSQVKAFCGVFWGAAQAVFGGDCFPYMMYIKLWSAHFYTYTCAEHLHGDKEAGVQGWCISQETAGGSQAQTLQEAPSLQLHQAASAHCPFPGTIAELPRRAACSEAGRRRPPRQEGCDREEGPIFPQVFALCSLIICGCAPQALCL